MQQVIRLSKFFDVSTDYLLGLTDDPAPSDADESRPIKDEDLNFALYGDIEIDEEVLGEVRRFAQFVRENKKSKKEEKK